MAKMTLARVDRWQKDLDRALGLVQKVSADVGSAKLTTSDATYSNVIDLGGQLVPVLNNLTGLIEIEPELSPIARIRKIVADAAAARKAAKT